MFSYFVSFENLKESSVSLQFKESTTTTSSTTPPSSCSPYHFNISFSLFFFFYIGSSSAKLLSLTMTTAKLNERILWSNKKVNEGGRKKWGNERMKRYFCFWCFSFIFSANRESKQITGSLVGHELRHHLQKALFQEWYTQYKVIMDNYEIHFD